MIVLDTAALLHWTLDPDKLTSLAAKAIDKSDLIIVNTISIWEIGLKAKRGQLQLPLSIQAYADSLDQLHRVDIQSVTVDIWLKNLALDWEHRDPADRTIVATAVLFNCPLISPDREIRKFYDPTIW